jgi:hypothetical protein
MSLKITYRLVRADDRVDVLKEVDPGRDLVRPVDVVRLLLVLAEVPSGVEELLRPDRSTKTNVLERVLTTGRAGDHAALEVLPHRVGAELQHPVVAQLSDPPVVEGDELHPQTVLATRA